MIGVVINVLRVLGILAALGSSVLTVARLLQGRLGTPAVQLAAFAPLALLGWPAAGILLLLGRVWWAAALCGAGAVLHLAWFRPVGHWAGRWTGRWVGHRAGRWAGHWAGPAPAEPPTLRVFTLNCLLGQANAAQIVNLVGTERIDVLLLEELTAGLTARLHAVGIDAVLGHHELHPRPGGVGTGIWSRRPLHALGLLDPDAPAMPQVVIDVLGVGPVTVTAVHTHPPLWRVVGRWRREMALLADAVAHRRLPVSHAGGDAVLEGPQIMAGDFNATRDHQEFRTLLAVGALVDTVEAVRPGGRGTGFTWPSDRSFPPLTRLDHILVSRDSIVVESHRVVAVEGSDHRGLMATLRFR